jgi:formylglycine-generating enzyme required for sulfatase activity
MKSPWLALCVIVAIAFLWITQAKPDEPEKAPSKPDAADQFIGKEAGQVRNDNDLKMKLVWCPRGEFTMGTPKSETQRRKNEDQTGVTLTTGFWLGKYEVTQSEWKQVMKTEPWKGQILVIEGADYPVTPVSWDDATEFCRKLTVRERQAGRLPDEWEYTLPTEAEWEYACRARSVTRFSFGDDASKLGEYAWFFTNTWDAGEKYLHLVGQKKPNPWGLCDMHGNVWEWCRDFYVGKLPGGRDPEVKVNPDEKSRAVFRVVRGGCWLTGAAFSRSGYRSGSEQNHRDDRHNFHGFRVALGAVQPVK